MIRRNLEEHRVDVERTRIEQLVRYVPRPQKGATVQFDIDLHPATVGESLFMLFSNRLRQAVYRGIYQNILNIEIDDVLTNDGGYDNLEFSLLQFDQKQLCAWSNERGEPYWQPGALVSIGLLTHRVVDAEGLSKRFDIRIRY